MKQKDTFLRNTYRIFLQTVREIDSNPDAKVFFYVLRSPFGNYEVSSIGREYENGIIGIHYLPEGNKFFHGFISGYFGLSQADLVLSWCKSQIPPEMLAALHEAHFVKNTRFFRRNRGN